MIETHRAYPKITGDEQGTINFYMNEELYKTVRYNRRFDKMTYIRDFEKSTRNIAYRIKFRYEIIIE